MSDLDIDPLKNYVKEALSKKYPQLDDDEALEDVYGYRNQIIFDVLGRPGYEETVIDMVQIYVHSNYGTN